MVIKPNIWVSSVCTQATFLNTNVEPMLNVGSSNI